MRPPGRGRGRWPIRDSVSSSQRTPPDRPIRTVRSSDPHRGCSPIRRRGNGEAAAGAYTLASMSHDFLVQLPAAPGPALLGKVRAELAKLPIRVELPGELDLMNDAGWVPVAVHAIDRPA